jgi:hypothetical protein
MREIKFRAWYGEKIGMLEPQFNGNINEIFADRNGAYMQYTGLKDKNGKKIYEGDIVQIKDHAFQGAMNIDGNYEVYYNEYMELCCGSLILFRQLPYLTVIGNTYENPELLEEKA